MPHFVEKRDPFGNSYALWVLAFMAFLSPLCWKSLSQTRLDNDVESWLPRNDPQLQILKWVHHQFPVEERVFVTWDGSSLGDPRILAVEKLLEGARDEEGIKRSGPVQISQVSQPFEVLAVMRKNGVEYRESVRRLSGALLGTGPLRVRLTETGNLQPRRIAQEISSRLQTDLKIVAEVRPGDPQLSAKLLPHDGVNSFRTSTTDETDESRKALTEDLLPTLVSPAGEILATSDCTHELQISWPSLRYGTSEVTQVCEVLKKLVVQDEVAGEQPAIQELFFAVGSPVMLAVSLTEQGLSERAESIAAIRAATSQAGIPDSQVHLAGSIVASHELNQFVAKAAWNKRVPWYRLHEKSIVLASAISGALLSWLVLRSVSLTVVVITVSGLTVFFSMALIPASGKSLNMVLVVLPALLFVITLSGAIHLANYWKHAMAHDPVKALEESGRAATLPCLLAAFTTAIGLASLVTSELAPVWDFGVFGAIGSLISVAMVLIALPAMLHLLPTQSAKSQELQHPRWRAFGKMIVRHPNAWAFVSMVVCVVAGAGLIYFQTETKVVRYFPKDSSVICDYQMLERNLVGITPVEIIVRFDKSSQESTVLLDRLSLVRQLQEKLRQHPEISGVISLADFLPVNENPGENATAMQRRGYNKRSHVVQSRLTDEDSAASRPFYSIADKEFQVHRGEDQILCGTGDELWRVTAQVAVLPNNDYDQIMADVHSICREHLRLQPGAAHELSGTVPVFLRTQQAVLKSLIESSVLSFALILGVFAILLRSLSAAFVAMIPNIYPNIIGFGYLAWTGVRVDIGTMITASIAIGMAVDGTLHLLTWFQAGMREGKTRQQAVIDALCHCGPALWQTAVVVSLGLLVLAPAELLLISRFGVLMTGLTVLALYGDVVLLVALLAGPFGRLFDSGQQGEHDANSGDSMPESMSVEFPGLSSPSQRSLSEAS